MEPRTPRSTRPDTLFPYTTLFRSPGGSITGVHQDGFFSPGIRNYKPVWTPLTDCEREVGGLMLAVRQCNRGFFHNLAKTPSSIPEGVIPDDSWATDRKSTRLNSSH